MKIFKRIIVALAVIALVFIIAIAGAVYALTRPDVQKRLSQIGVEMLAEKLQTRLNVDHIGVNFEMGGVSLYGLTLADRNDTTMLHVDTLEASIEMMPLIKGKVSIDEVKLHGATAILYKERADSAANYQFVIDAFKPKKEADNTTDKKNHKPLELALERVSLDRITFRWDVYSIPRKPAGKFDPNHIWAKNLAVRIKGNPFDKEHVKLHVTELRAHELNAEMDLSVDKIDYDGKLTTAQAEITKLRARWADKKLRIRTLTAEQLADGRVNLHVDSLRFHNNNGKPRKNAGKPNRGFFDPGHLDAWVNMEATIHRFNPDTLSASITHFAAYDKGSGLDIRSMTADINKYGDTLTVKNTKISLPRTKMQIPCCRLTITPKSRDGKTPADVCFGKTPVTAYVVLADIAKPFAPRLSNFTTPLTLHVNVSGNLKRILFSNILVTSIDRRLKVTAEGDLCDVTKNRQLSLHFNNIQMSARGGIKEQIINHFAKKLNLKMQRQTRALGDIGFRGNLGIFYKRQDLGGVLLTNFGNVKFEFTLDAKTKYMTGTLSTDSFAIGPVMKVKGLHSMRAAARYSFNIANKRTRKAEGVKGKLPIGWLDAIITNVKYRGLSFKHLTTFMTSDGTEAQGDFVLRQGPLDLIIDFIYHQDEKDQSYKYKIRLKRHQGYDEEKMLKRLEKEEMAAEKAAQKAERKAAKAAEKAEKKAAKAIAKAEKKAAKEAAKAEKKAAKEAAKAAKKAANQNNEI